jgi:hypothetical protein
MMGTDVWKRARRFVEEGERQQAEKEALLCKLAKMRSLMVVLLSCLPAVASSEVRAALFDDSKRLEGKIILKVGDLEKLNSPPFGKYDCMSWPTDLFEIDDVCVRILGYYGMGFGELAMIASDNEKAISAFVVERSGLSTKISMYSLSIYECPDFF